MQRMLTVGLFVGAAAVLAMSVPAEAGGPKFRFGDGHYLEKVPTYLSKTVDETAQDPGSPGNLWVGTGIPAGGFVLRRYEDAGIELAIKAHYRQGHDIAPTYIDKDGVVHVEVPAGHQVVDPEHGVPVDHPGRARWNFTFSYDVALDPGNPDLDAYRGWLLIDVDPSRRTKFLALRLAKLTDSPSGQQSGYGWKAGDTVVIGDDEGTSQVTQNSQNLAFYEEAIDADPHAPGQQSYAAADYGPGEFDVVMLLERRHGRKASALHVVFDVVEP